MTTHPFFVKISGSKLTPIAIHAANTIAAAKIIMLAQPELWRDNPRGTSVRVRDGELGPQRFVNCQSVLTHFTAEEIVRCQARPVRPAQSQPRLCGDAEDEDDEGLAFFADAL